MVFPSLFNVLYREKDICASAAAIGLAVLQLGNIKRTHSSRKFSFQCFLHYFQRSESRILCQHSAQLVLQLQAFAARDAVDPGLDIVQRVRPLLGGQSSLLQGLDCFEQEGPLALDESGPNVI